MVQKKSNIIVLTLLIILVAGCACNQFNTVSISESPLPPVWRVGLTECVINGDQRESILVSALVTFGVSAGISWLRSAMSAAGKEKTIKGTSYHADYLSQGVNARACVIIGLGSPRRDEFQRLKSGFVRRRNSTYWSDTIKSTDKSESGINTRMLNDTFQLGFMLDKAPEFLVRFRFNKSFDSRAIHPQIDYLFYPHHLVDRNNEAQELVITVDGKVPTDVKTSSIALSARIPSIKANKNKVYEIASLPDLQYINGWINVPSAWLDECEDTQVDNSDESMLCNPINLNAEVIGNAEGSAFWKSVSGAISDSQANALTTAISTKLNEDVEEAEKIRLAEDNAYIQAYLDALAAYKKKVADTSVICSSESGSIPAISAAKAEISAAHNKASVALGLVPKGVEVPPLEPESDKVCTQEL